MPLDARCTVAIAAATVIFDLIAAMARNRPV